MQDLCESLTSEILSHVATADRWLLQFVCKQFRAIVRPTLHHGDPRRRRVLDDVLEYAVANGGVATVRFLFDKKSNVWATAVEKAASKGDLEMVRLVVDRGSAKRAMTAALDEGHVGVAENLLPHINLEEDFEAMFVSSLISSDILEWTVSQMPSSWSSHGIKNSTMIFAFVKACWNFGNLGCIQYLCNFFGKERIASTVFAPGRQMPFFVFCKYVIPISVLRFLDSTFGYQIDLKQMSPMHDRGSFDNDLLDYLLESQGFDAMQTAAADDLCVYTFLVGKRLIPRADFAAAASKVKYACQLEVLMKLYPDLADWTAEAGLVKRLLERGDDMQTAFGTFFRSQKVFNFNFEIKCCDKVAIDALRAMGGKCTSGTLWKVVCDSDDVELARSVWAAMDAQERDRFQYRNERYMVGAPDLGILEFVALELKAVDRLREINLLYFGQQRSRFTVSLARFLLEHRIMDSLQLLTHAVSCEHFDVVETVVTVGQIYFGTLALYPTMSS
jgi:hypothetical protein